MKKFILSVLALIVSASMFALDGETAAYQIDVYVGAESVDNIVLTEAPIYTDGFDNMYDGIKASMGTGDSLIYSLLNDMKLSIVARPNLAGTFITFQAGDGTQYKLVVEAWVAKENLAIRDHLTNLEYDLVDAAEISFTQEAHSKVLNRFEIFSKSFTPDEGDLEVCHIGDNLEVRNNPFAANIVVKNEAGEEVINIKPAATPQIISLASLEAGRYTVEFNEGAEVFVIAVKPEVTPAP